MLRGKRAMSRKELASRIGIAESAYGRYESLRVGINVEMLHRIANALDVTVDDLLPALPLPLMTR